MGARRGRKQSLIRQEKALGCSFLYWAHIWGYLTEIRMVWGGTLETPLRRRFVAII